MVIAKWQYQCCRFDEIGEHWTIEYVTLAVTWNPSMHKEIGLRNKLWQCSSFTRLIKTEEMAEFRETAS